MKAFVIVQVLITAFMTLGLWFDNTNSIAYVIGASVGSLANVAVNVPKSKEGNDE
ncbi:hypothetical protein LCGC14_2061480 [marine sediment metagenome]|uniref:Uncharacterized protein n=1 Tax=marine sediment metagenome TaxID=412755 RepID=A0A0F9GZL2_9ZZZZ